VPAAMIPAFLWIISCSFLNNDGGEGGIRTPDTVARMPHFECGAFNHSATSPQKQGWAERRACVFRA
jgi:hypothetical protein